MDQKDELDNPDPEVPHLMATTTSNTTTSNTAHLPESSQRIKDSDHDNEMAPIIPQLTIINIDEYDDYDFMEKSEEKKGHQSLIMELKQQQQQQKQQRHKQKQRLHYQPTLPPPPPQERNDEDMHMIPTASNSPIITPPTSPPRVLLKRGGPANSTTVLTPPKAVTFDPSSKRTKKAPPVPLQTQNLENEDMRSTVQRYNNSTFQTMSSSTTPTTVSSTPTSIIITTPEKNQKGSKDRGTGTFVGFFFKQKKTILSVLLLYSFIATGAGSYFFTQFLRIPGLDNQIEELRSEINRLETQNDILKHTNDRLENNVNKLNETNNRLESNIQTLAKENEVFSDTLSALNETKNELHRVNGELHEVNMDYQENNNRLQRTNVFLQSNLTYTNQTVQNLKKQVNTTEALVTVLQRDIVIFENLKANLTEKVDNFTIQVEVLNNENERLQNTTNNLRNIVSFLNETNLGFERTLSSVSDFLGQQISGYRVERMSNLNLLYRQIVTKWDCDLISRFRLRDFTKNITQPIGPADITDVMDHVDEQVLTELCINRTDFEHSLQTSILEPPKPLSNMSITELETGVAIYTTKVLDYYFPDAGETGGLTESDWSAAQFDCSKLATPPFQF